MKNKFLKIIIAVFMLIPCSLLFVACGKLTSVDGKLFVFSKVEVTGSLSVEEYENLYSSITLDFDEDTVLYNNETTYNYKLEDGSIYLKGLENDEYSNVFAKISGKYLVVTETYEGGIVKIYFETK